MVKNIVAAASYPRSVLVIIYDAPSTTPSVARNILWGFHFLLRIQYNDNQYTVNSST